mgnify:CR=1 FL=1
MPRLISHATRIQAAGNKPKLIDEFVGVVNSGHTGVSVARMTSPSGWIEPGQRPQFEEITLVLKGMVRVEHEGGVLEVRADLRAWGRSGAEWRDLFDRRRAAASISASSKNLRRACAQPSRALAMSRSRSWVTQV